MGNRNISAELIKAEKEVRELEKGNPNVKGFFAELDMAKVGDANLEYLQGVLKYHLDVCYHLGWFPKSFHCVLGSSVDGLRGLPKRIQPLIEKNVAVAYVSFDISDYRNRDNAID